MTAPLIPATTPPEPPALCLQLIGCGRCGQPLPPRRRSWCSDTCRQAWYIEHLWRYARAEALHRANQRCLGCGQYATEVDHITERHGHPLHRPTCLHHQANLRALCHDCHVHRRTVFAEQAS
jgi:hypothetical protein